MLTRSFPTVLVTLAVVGGTATAQAPPSGGAVGVHDGAKIFSADAVAKADGVLRAVQKEGRWQILVETRDGLGGKTLKDAAVAIGKERQVHGLVVLIDKAEKKFWVEPSRSAEKAFPEAERGRVREALAKSFAKGDFDRGLLDAAAEIRNAALKVGVRDGARMFSAEAVAKADKALEDLREKTRWRAVVETVDSLGGKPLNEVAAANARALQVHGVYVLIAKDEHKVYVEPSVSAERTFTREKAKGIQDAIVGAFKAKAFDKGLLDTVEAIRRDAEAAGPLAFADETDTGAAAGTAAAAFPPPSPKNADVAATPATAEPKTAPDVKNPARPAPEKRRPMLTFLLIAGGLALLFLWLTVKVLRALFGGGRSPNAGYANPGPGAAPRPGYGPSPLPNPNANPGQRPGYGPAPGYGPQPGYGPAPAPGYGGYGAPPAQGGGGFMSGVLGGAAGAVAGNILYDKFGHPHQAGDLPPGAGLPTHAGGPYTGADVGAGAGAGAGFPGDPTQETYDPNAGVGGDWGNDPGQGGGADWNAPDPAAEAATGGDWGGGQDDAATGGDWGGDQGADQGGGDWGGDTGGNNDDQNQGGDW